MLLPSNHLALSPRWQGWFVRGQSGLLLMSCFYTIVSLGPWGLFSLTHIVQAASFYEVMSLGESVTGVTSLRAWSWLLFLLANLSLASPLSQSEAGLLPPSLSYSLYLCLMMTFLASIRDSGECLSRYCLLAWAHAALLFLSVQAAAINLTLKHGMVWCIFAFSVITINDIGAYMFGFFLGSRPLTVLSPRKTVEGFIGGGITTVVLGPLYGLLLQNCPSLLCPTQALSVIPGCDPYSVSLYSGHPSPFLTHCLMISIFASSIGPLAGFFCSGFKRACNKKNFGSLIPGHGGVLDRCDCMFLMASFTYMYLETVVY